MLTFKHSKLLLVLLFSCVFSFGQIPLDKTATVSILTCETGDELYSLFGHTAIRIQDPTNDLDVIYNYGAFDFATENFYVKFIKGDLQYFATANPYNEFLFQYTQENRSIVEQKLLLTQNQKQELFEILNKSLLSDKKYYTYKFIDRNCTNMVSNKINLVLNQKCILKNTEKGMTYREILYPYIENHFYENLGINIIFGKKVDQDGTTLFLPTQLMESLKVSKYNGKLIAAAPKTILKAIKLEQKKSIWDNFYSFCLIFILLILSRKTWVYLSYFIVISILGFFLSGVGFYSFHEEVSLNYNVLLFNPFLLVLVICFLKKKYLWVTRIAQFSIVGLTTYLLILINKPNFLMFMPMIICSYILLLYFHKRSKKELLTTVK